jgi:hypothetical protein
MSVTTHIIVAMVRIAAPANVVAVSINVTTTIIVSATKIFCRCSAYHLDYVLSCDQWIDLDALKFPSDALGLFEQTVLWVQYAKVDICNVDIIFFTFLCLQP